jgi:hypothetical protein
MSLSVMIQGLPVTVHYSFNPSMQLDPSIPPTYKCHLPYAFLESLHTQSSRFFQLRNTLLEMIPCFPFIPIPFYHSSAAACHYTLIYRLHETKSVEQWGPTTPTCVSLNLAAYEGGTFHALRTCCLGTASAHVIVCTRAPHQGLSKNTRVSRRARTLAPLGIHLSSSICISEYWELHPTPLVYYIVIY